jgi:branched-chain amino acid transport system permease protein
MLASAIVAATLLQVGLRYSSLGRKIRATAENLELAKVRGIDTDRTISIVFMIGSSLAAVAGIMIAYESQVTPQIGFLPGMKGFITALVGGLGNIGGTMIAGLILGVVENVMIWKLPTVYKDAIAFLIMIGFLLFRPQGLFPNKWKRF